MEPTSDEALLTTYLDGELSPQDRQLLEQRLANEPELRERLVLMEETWHCLDLLEQESPDATQIETTLQLAAVSVSATPFVPQKITRSLRWRIAALAGVVLFAVAFHLGSQPFLDDPSFRQMIERYDMYLAVSDDGLELLQQLAIRRVFLPTHPDDASPIDPEEYNPRPSRTWIPRAWSHRATDQRNEFDDPELYRLFYNNLQRFRSLSPKKSQQIRELHHSIEMTPGSVELAITLQNYYHWRKSLQSYEKAELRQQKSIDERVARIIGLKNHLDELQSDGTPRMLSEIINYEETERLADTLAELPTWQQERLLNDDPIQIISKLKQAVSADDRR